MKVSAAVGGMVVEVIVESCDVGPGMVGVMVPGVEGGGVTVAGWRMGRLQAVRAIRMTRQNKMSGDFITCSLKSNARVRGAPGHLIYT